jgi:hypothetical protein
VTRSQSGLDRGSTGDGYREWEGEQVGHEAARNLHFTSQL